MNDDVHTILFATPSTNCVRWIYAKISVINIECNKKKVHSHTVGDHCEIVGG